MPRLPLAIFLGILGFSAAAFAAPPGPDPDLKGMQPPAITQPDLRAALFEILVIKGDNERLAGHKVEAANAYMQALEIKRDPLIEGRLGLLLADLGRYVQAAGLLLQAIKHARAADDVERQLFYDAYTKAFHEATWVDVTISVAGARTMLDGEQKNVEGNTAFSIFVGPGSHKISASREGYKDAVISFTAKKGEEQQIHLVLEPLPTTEAAPKESLLRKHKLDGREGREITRNAEDPPEDAPEKRVVVGGVEGAPMPEKTRMSVEGGPVVVFGVATWAPAVGAMAGVRWRLKEYFSLGVEGRAAWLTAGIKGEPINAMTAGALASGCLHWRWVYGCAVGHLGIVNVKFGEPVYEPRSDTFFKPGFGGRMGANYHLGRGFVLGGSFDAMGLSRGTKVLAGQTELVNHPPVMLGAQIVGAWEF